MRYLRLETNEPSFDTVPAQAVLCDLRSDAFTIHAKARGAEAKPDVLLIEEASTPGSSGLGNHSELHGRVRVLPNPKLVTTYEERDMWLSLPLRCLIEN